MLIVSNNKEDNGYYFILFSYYEIFLYFCTDIEKNRRYNTKKNQNNHALGIINAKICALFTLNKKPCYIRA